MFSAASWFFLVPIRTPIYTGKDPGLYMGRVREETYLRGEMRLILCVENLGLN